MSDFLFSAESRWFSQGPIPQSLHEWFHRSLFSSQPSQRTDQYLVFPNADNLGVKFREGRFEIKVRLDELKDCKIGNIHGIIELWEKWSSQEIAVTLFSMMHSPEHLIDVKKSRTLRLFSVEKNVVTEKDLDMGYVSLERGCQMELTEIEIQDGIFWSLGFEAFSEFQDQFLILADTMKTVLETGDCPVELNRNLSGSYPALLHRLRYGD